MTKKSDRPRRNKARLNITIWPETKDRLARAAHSLGIQQTDYIEIALRSQFKKDGIQ
jgi:hypothetical protein